MPSPALPSANDRGHIRLSYAIPVPIGAGETARAEIWVSTRRRRYAQAHLERGLVVVVVPSRCSVREREELAVSLTRQLLTRAGRRQVTSDEALERRAHVLSDRYLGGVRPTSIRWVTNQARRWGSCTPATGAIRLSSRLVKFPGWVLDGVVVHELAHLLEASHSPEFKALVGRYQRAAETDAFLLGVEHGDAAAREQLGPECVVPPGSVDAW